MKLVVRDGKPQRARHTHVHDEQLRQRNRRDHQSDAGLHRRCAHRQRCGDEAAFHNDATIFGYVGRELFGGPIQGLYDWNDQNGPATDIQSLFTSIDVVGTAANVRLDTDNWTGHRFTDFFNLEKFYGQWKVVSKVFYLHP